MGWGKHNTYDIRYVVLCDIDAKADGVVARKSINNILEDTGLWEPTMDCVSSMIIQ